MAGRSRLAPGSYAFRRGRASILGLVGAALCTPCGRCGESGRASHGPREIAERRGLC